MIVLLSIGCLLLLLYYFITKNYNYWESRGIPSEKPAFPFGNFSKVITRKQHFSERICELYSRHRSPYVGIYIFNQPYLMVRSPELIKSILVKDFDKFTNRPLAVNESVDPISFHSLFGAQDSTWRNLRAKISPIFTSGKMKLMLPLMKECNRDLVSYLVKHNGQAVDVGTTVKKLSVDVISSCAFGINSRCFENEDSDIMVMATRLLNFRSAVRNFSIACFFFAPKLANLLRLTFGDKRAAHYLMNIFNVTYKERKEKNIVRNDLIDLLNNLKSNEKFDDTYKFDDVKMAAQAITFFSAGNDSTSVTLTFAFYELAMNPEVQNSLRNEIKDIFENGDLTYESIQNAKYLDAVLKETLRKYPLTTFLSRVSNADYTVEGTGINLEKNTKVLIPTSGLHYDPQYFSDPHTFKPERFIKEHIKQYTFMPFGDGPRICIGERFAYLVMKIALSYVIKNFTLEPTKETPTKLELAPSAIFLQSKDAVYLRIKKIES